MAARRSRLVETRLLAEYLAVRFPKRHVRTRVRVGQVPQELRTDYLRPGEEAMLSVWRRWVDAIVVDGNILWAIEAAVLPDPGDIGQLDLYMKLLPTTPDLQEFRRLRLKGLLLYGVDDPVIRDLAAGRGYAVEIFRPAWVDEYLATLYPRRRRAPLPPGENPGLGPGG